MNRWPERSTATLIAIAGAHLLSAVALAFLADHRRDTVLLAGLILGTMFGQVSLLAGWVVLGPLSGVIRWPGAICGCLVSGFMGIVFFGTESGPDLLEVVLVIVATVAALFLCVQAPIWWLRLRHGYQLLLPGEMGLPSGLGETQFSLRHLLIATTLFALILGVGRIMAGSIQWSETEKGVQLEPFLLFGILVAFSSGLAWLTLAAAFSRLFSASVALLILVVLAPLSWLDSAVLNLYTRSSEVDNHIIIFLLNYTQFAWLFGCLLALRWAGYRLVTTPVGASMRKPGGD